RPHRSEPPRHRGLTPSFSSSRGQGVAREAGALADATTHGPGDPCCMTSTNGSAQAAGLDGAGVALAASEIGLKITPDASPSLESTFAAQLDAIVRRACQIARA